MDGIKQEMKLKKARAARAARAARKVRGVYSAPSRIVLTSKALVAKRDEARVRREARAVLGAQSRWLDVPNGMYGGKRPIDLVRSGHSEIVLDVLARVKYGMFS